MSASAMSLKAQIRNLAKKKNIKAQVLLQNFMFERFLERLSLSEYKDKFVIKSGMLVASLVGLDARSTMDLDATLRDLPLTEEAIQQAVASICAHPVQDEVRFAPGAISFIRPDDVYGGYRVKITAVYDTIETPFSVDITTGDVITPQAVKYTLHGVFDEDKRIEIWAYNLETVMAEKLETILRRSTLNTRPRDFYDIYILHTTQRYSTQLLKEAIAATATHRETTEQIADVPALLQLIESSTELRQMWDKYRREFSYAANITYEQVIKVLNDVCASII